MILAILYKLWVTCSVLAFAIAVLVDYCEGPHSRLSRQTFAAAMTIIVGGAGIGTLIYTWGYI